MRTGGLYRTILLIIFLIVPVFAYTDWPIYKGNIYYTGNNDEVTVKNNNLKWLYEAEDAVFNPIVSDGRVYFTDRKKNLYCLEEQKGKLLWKIDLRKISSQFTAYSKAYGKVKYPLIKGDRIFITDNIAIYCINKLNGSVIWARTGMREETGIPGTAPPVLRGREEKKPGFSGKWSPAPSSTATVDGIYADPVISGDVIYYGTRNVFAGRDIMHGRLIWKNSSIRTYSGFPSFYDRYVFTQSRDYQRNTFSLYCMKANDGEVIWNRQIPAPMKIFSPVVYRGRVFMASGKSLYCLDLKTGADIWTRTYDEYITSNPAFTERAVLIALGNRMVVMVNPGNGNVAAEVDPGDRASPYFVIVRDQIYIASTFEKKVGGRPLPYTSVQALRLTDRGRLWEYVPPFPGGAHRPVASKGILFLPAGNYLYAVGTDYYPRIVRGGSGYYDPYRKYDSGKTPEKAEKKEIKKSTGGEIPMRKMKITVTDRDGKSIPAQVEIRKWDKGRVIYSGKTVISRTGQPVDVPDMDDVEITATSKGFLPGKIIISKKDGERKINLEKIEKGRGIVVENIYFEINEAYLKKESLNILDRIIEALKENSRIRLEVRGHTDATGTRAHNQKLSERRADSVIEYMIKNGISPERLSAKGFGPDRPIADNRKAEGRRKNRRTEFFILDK